MATFRTKHDRSEAAATVLMEHSPAVAGLLLWANHRDSPEGMRGTCTDGKTIYYDDWFAALPLNQQIGVMTHEVLHVALCHPARALRLRQREGDDYRGDLWNAAADALINASIMPLTHEQWIDLPPGVTLDGLEVELHKLGYKGSLTPESHDAEALYALLKSHAKKVTQKIEAMFGGKSGKSQPPDGRGMSQDIKMPDQGEVSEAEQEQEMREWARRIERAAIGDRPGGILRKLRDLPSTETPWEAILRSTLMHATAAHLEATWARPSRRWLGLHHRGMPYEQGLQRKPQPTIVTCIDSSGSIDDDLFDRFIAETRAICTKTHAKMVVIIADADVQSVTIVTQESEIAKIEFTGRGGTDFRPALTEALNHKPAYCVYLTDLMGSFPETAPKFPVLWAVPEPYKDSMPPFGKRLVLK